MSSIEELEQGLANLRAASPAWPQEGDELADLIIGLQSRVIRLEDRIAGFTVTLDE